MKNIFYPLFLFAIIAITDSSFAQDKIYVDSSATGAGTGDSWEHAFIDLQDALTTATENDTICVAKGTYTPAGAGGNVTATFTIAFDLAVLGGFPSGGGDRDPVTNPTILSGDLDNNDVADDFESFKEDNVLHVVTVTSEVSDLALIDGFTIQGGYADDSSFVSGDDGGGIYSGGPLHILNCLITQNYAETHGGGLYVNNLASSGAEFIVEHSTFTKNVAERGGGASILSNALDTDFLLTDNTFHQNTTLPSPWGCGSGLEAFLRGENVNFELRNSSFTENSGAVAGGGAVIYGNSFSVNGTVVVDSCIFESNTSGISGGLAVGSLPNAGLFEFSISNCQMLNNVVDNYGGGLDLYSESPSIITIENCYLEGNESGDIAGGIGIATTSSGFQVVARNCTLKNNSSPSGSAIGATPEETNEPGNTQSASIRFENCLAIGHTGSTTIDLRETGNIQLLNCTIADNDGVGITLDANSAITLQNTILYNPGYMEYGTMSQGNLTSLGGNLLSDNTLIAHENVGDQHEVADPGFVGANDYHLQYPGSPAIGTGLNENISFDYDLDGNPRETGCIDIGVYEHPDDTSTDCLVDINEVTIEQLAVFPNPASTHLQIDFPDNSTFPVSISIEDLNGKLIKNQMIQSGEPVDVSNFVAGMYFLKMEMEDVIYLSKFVKM